MHCLQQVSLLHSRVKEAALHHQNIAFCSRRVHCGSDFGRICSQLPVMVLHWTADINRAVSVFLEDEYRIFDFCTVMLQDSLWQLTNPHLAGKWTLKLA